MRGVARRRHARQDVQTDHAPEAENMSRNDPHDWMWAEAVAVLARAERMQHQLFQPRRTPAASRVPEPAPHRTPSWSPPVDVIETDHAVLILIALPGVAAEAVEAVLEDGALLVSGRRVLPAELRTAVIHRLELPQGRFERRIPIPAGRYDGVRRAAQDGCLLISLHKAR